MNIFLHTPNSASDLQRFYHQAFDHAVELFIVTAYLTDWDSTLVLNQHCKQFGLIVGKDFGITRKAACISVMKWLPKRLKGRFMVAEGIGGFHPKAVFWRGANKSCFAIIGSSNLTRAAFESNYEANVCSEISEEEYKTAVKWFRQIEKKSLSVSND